MLDTSFVQPPCCSGRAASRPILEAGEFVEKVLQKYAGTPPSEDHKTTRYLAAPVDLNGDGVPEIIVYLTGREWCGSGGCTTLILARGDSSFTIVTKITVTQLPIRVLKLRSRSHGWRDISIGVRGGGIQPEYEAELSLRTQDLPHESIHSSCPASGRERIGAGRNTLVAKGHAPISMVREVVMLDFFQKAL